MFKIPLACWIVGKLVKISSGCPTQLPSIDSESRYADDIIAKIYAILLGQIPDCVKTLFTWCWWCALCLLALWNSFTFIFWMESDVGMLHPLTSFLLDGAQEQFFGFYYCYASWCCKHSTLATCGPLMSQLYFDILISMCLLFPLLSYFECSLIKACYLIPSCLVELLHLHFECSLINQCTALWNASSSR